MSQSAPSAISLLAGGDWFAAISAILGAWLLTYLLHSTAFLSIGLLINATMRGASEWLRELVLRFALVGGVASATVTMLLPPMADGAPGWWSDVAGFSGAAAQTLSSNSGRAPPLAVAPDFNDAAGAWPLISMPGGSGIAQESAALPLQQIDLAPRGPALSIMLLAFGIGCVLAVKSILLSHSRLRRELRGRIDLPADSRPARLLDQLVGAAGLGAGRRWTRIRLTSTEGLAVPIAMGILRPEICLPGHRVDALDDAELRLVLAHELGHIVRRDPQWQLFHRAIEGVFFFQPLNVFARRALRTIAEFQCDAWAARATGERTRLARVLTDVAQWLISSGDSKTGDLLAPAAAMAERRSGIRRRIERLLSRETSASNPARRRAVVAAICAASIACVALGSPRFAPARTTSIDPGATDHFPDAPTGGSTLEDTLHELLADLDAEVTVLEGEAALLGARARAAGADEDTLSLAADISNRIAALGALRREAERAIGSTQFTPTTEATLGRSSTVPPPSSPATTGRRSP